MPVFFGQDFKKECLFHLVHSTSHAVIAFLLPKCVFARTEHFKYGLLGSTPFGPFYEFY